MPTSCAARSTGARSGIAAQLLGLAAALLDMTVEYVAQRRQFGAPIGSFQAIKHKLADVRIALEFARPLVVPGRVLPRARRPRRLGPRLDGQGPGRRRRRARARHALQCHGAIGYSFEYDLHLWMKRAWALVPTWGDAAWHRERVARAIL